MTKEKMLDKVERNEIPVSEYLNYRSDKLIKKRFFVRKHRFKKSKGFKIIFIKGNFIIMPPRIPIRLLKFLSRFLYKVNSKSHAVQIEHIDFKEITAALRSIEKNTMLVDIQSKEDSMMIQIWSV